MPFDPDELANGMMKWLEHGRKPKQAPADPKPSPPPAEMPGSGPSIEELQEQIKALQEQLKTINGNADVPMAPRGEPIHPLGPGRDAPRLTPHEIHKRDLEEFDKWRHQDGGQHGYIGRRDIDPGFYIPADPDAPDIDPGHSFQPDPMDPPKAFMYPNQNKHIGDMPSWGPYKNEPRGGYEYDSESPAPMTELPYELLNGTGSPVEGLNLKVGRHGNNYTPSKVTPGKGASLN